MFSAADLETCDREPIHIPGGIQPHGFLMAADPATLRVLRVSENVRDHLGIDASAILGHELSEFISTPIPIDIHEFPRDPGQTDLNPFRVEFRGTSATDPFDGIAHLNENNLILEFEPREKPADFGPFAATRLARQALSGLRQSQSVRELCEHVVREVRRLTDFDRVVMYKFDDDWNGSVIAEDRAEHAASFAGLHFPASDIPKQARDLYRRNRMRIIPTNDYVPSPILDLPGPNAPRGPLDLSHSLLRTVSPVHLEYMRNMNARASMSISIIQDGELWGLIAATHEAGPKYLPYEIRLTCEFLGEITSSLLAAKEKLQDADARVSTKSKLSDLLVSMSREKNFVQGLVGSGAPHLLDLVGATGAALYFNGTYSVVGATPSDEQIERIVQWLSQRPDEEIFATDRLSMEYPPAESFRDRACGLLAASLSRGQNNYVLWFRPEVIQSIPWSGKPEKNVETTGGETRVHPRRSFALWRESVAERSDPWSAVQLEAAADLRRAMIDIILQRTEEVSKLNRELERSNVELDAFAYAASHDLKEPLRGIYNYTMLAIDEIGERGLVGESGPRLRTVVKLTQRMEDLINSLLHYSQVGRMKLSLREENLNTLVTDAVEMLKPTLEKLHARVTVAANLPPVQCDRVRVGEVFSNLLSNALKYTDKDMPVIEVGFYADGGRVPVFFVRDNGIGIREKNQESIFRIFKRLHKRDQFGGGSGTGLTITKRIVERHGGRIWLRSTPGVGTTFYFTLSEGTESHVDT